MLSRTAVLSSAHANVLSALYCVRTIYRYEIEEECLLVYIYELQVANHETARRKGLGRFFLMLAEMLAKKTPRT